MSRKISGWMARHKAELFELSPYAAASLLLPGGTFLAALAVWRRVAPSRRSRGARS